jgi:hypothetical protein
METNTMNETFYKLLSKWIYSTQIKIFIPVNELVERPPGGEVILFQLDFPKKIDCVYYKVPIKNFLGKLKVVEVKNSSVCPETNASEGAIEISQISNLKLQYDNFQLKINFNRLGKALKMEFPFYNIQKGIIHQKFNSSKVVSLISGLELLDTPKIFIGKLSDHFDNRQALRCHQVNSKCETIGEFRCNECRYGWYEVVDYNCPQGGSKFCGQNHCGEKNAPACPRGYQLFKDEETGICQSELRAVYNEDHVLVCQ